MNASLTVRYYSTAAAASKNVVLVIRDFSSDAIIVGANVTVTGPGGYSYTGTSDVNGKVYLGMRPPGQYALLATAAGYQSSDKDFLANDTFTV